MDPVDFIFMIMNSNPAEENLIVKFLTVKVCNPVHYEIYPFENMYLQNFNSKN